MTRFRLLGLVAAAAIAALALGGLATFVRQTAASTFLVASAAVFVLVALLVVAGSVLGGRRVPDETPYW